MSIMKKSHGSCFYSSGHPCVEKLPCTVGPSKGLDVFNVVILNEHLADQLVKLDYFPLLLYCCNTGVMFNYI